MADSFVSRCILLQILNDHIYLLSCFSTAVDLPSGTETAGIPLGCKVSVHHCHCSRNNNADAGRVNAHGFAFISPEYRLIPPSTGHAVLEDIKDLFTFLFKMDLSTAMRYTESNSDEKAFQLNFELDRASIVVAGSSAGGLCAYLAAVHCDLPKPRAILSMYGMGGNFFVGAFFTFGS
jgi:hypothetical protein